MKLIRRPPTPAAAPPVESKADTPVEPVDTSSADALRSAATAMELVSTALAEKMAQQPPAPAPRPTVFSCKVTARDKDGRIADFDIFVKDASHIEDDDPFTAGYNNTTR